MDELCYADYMGMNPADFETEDDFLFFAGAQLDATRPFFDRGYDDDEILQIF